MLVSVSSGSLSLGKNHPVVPEAQLGGAGEQKTRRGMHCCDPNP